MFKAVQIRGMNLKQMLFGLAWTWAQISAAQHCLLFETVGNVSSTQSLNAHVLSGGFDQEVLTFSSGDATNAVDIRNSSNSSGSYVTFDSVAASGGANVWFSSSGERGFSMHGIRASAFDSLQLYFAYRKESASSNADFQIEYSTDQAQTWDSLSGIILPADSLSTGWYYIGPIQLPSAAQKNGLALRWIKSQGSMRIDDISLLGRVSTPFIEQESSLTDFFGSAFYQPSSWQKLQINLVGFDVGDSILAMTHAPFYLNSDTSLTRDSLYIQVESIEESQNIWIRLNEQFERGHYSDTIFFSRSNLALLSVPASGRLYHAGEENVHWDCESDSFNHTLAGLALSPPSQGNNHGTTQFLSSSSSSENYSGSSGNQNAALAVHTGSLDTSSSSYIAWQIFPVSGKEILLNGISFGLRATSTGPQSWALRSSADSFQTNLYSSSLENDATWHWMSKDSFVLRFEDTITFRLYLYDGSGSASTNIANFRMDDLHLDYTVWNSPEVAAYRTQKNGAIQDSSIWSYAYYDSLYQSSNRLPDSTHSIEIRASDSCWLNASTELNHVTVKGTLNLNKQNLLITGALLGEGMLISEATSTLEIQGNDSSLLHFSRGDSLYALYLTNGSPRVYLMDTLRLAKSLFPGAGTLYSNGLLHLGSLNGKMASIDPRGKGAIDGALCMQTLIPGSNVGWRGFMSPLDTVTLGQLGTQIEVHIQNTASTGDNRNIYQWEENTASWNAVSNAAYSLHDSAVNMYLFQADSTMIELCGLYDTTNRNFGALTFTHSTSQSEGWHFIGNPFPSALRWSEVSLPTGVNGNYALWSVQDGNYRTWNGNIGSAGDLIPPFQGFWMKVNQGLNQDFILSNSYRDTGAVNHFGKRSNQVAYLQVQVKDGTSAYQDAVFLALDAGSKHFVAPKLFGKIDAPQIWIRSNQEDSASISYDDGSASHKLFLSIPKTGTYHFKLDYQGSGACEWVVYDQQTETSYSFDELQSIPIPLEAGYHSNRFILIRKPTHVPTNKLIFAPSISINKPYLNIQNPIPSQVRIYSLDGRLLGSYLSESTDTGRFGPIPYWNGIYLIEMISQQTTHRQLIYLP